MIVLSPGRVMLIRGCVVVMVGAHITTYLQYRRLVKRYNALAKKFNGLHDVATYLIQMCEEQNLDISEFDLLAMEYLSGRESNAS